MTVFCFSSKQRITVVVVTGVMASTNNVFVAVCLSVTDSITKIVVGELLGGVGFR